ncbi:MAG: translation initiation factor IF-2 [Gammaproteobacteria bacterium]|jgi:translation initiation factor IF-2|nr:translation initiation factor IF-2 [Gammaproteobacteria bacterium]MBT7603286.1 translation initiation factor IF-2 [Gammaproteobacteria bacterium]
MTDITVKQFSKTVGLPVNRLIDQLELAGVKNKSEGDSISDEEKMQLLDYVRKNKKTISTIQNESIEESKSINGKNNDKDDKQTKTVIRKNRVFSKVNNQVTKKVEPKIIEKNDDLELEDEISNDVEIANEVVEDNDIGVKEIQEVTVPETDKNTDSNKKRKKRSKTKFVNDDKTNVIIKQKRRRQKIHISDDNRGLRRKSSKKDKKNQGDDKHQFEKPTVPAIYEVELGEFTSVAEIASSISVKAAEVIKTLMKMGVMSTINEALDQDTATLVIEEMGHKAKSIDYKNLEKNLLIIEPEEDYELESRPPTITIMGHVDHGKTSLLDYIRTSRIASGEAGGITQHIGAYQVETKHGLLTFLDTPGHAAFTSMRARGANCTDIVILVVAADDGVKPQTIEAIEHSKAADVPIIVAVNKIDKEGVDIEKVKTELTQYEIVPEEWGGDNIFVEVSAKEGTGVENLLESISLLSEVLELKAIARGSATGIVLESALDKGKGATATVLVQKGCMNTGENILCGKEFGRIRAMIDQNGKRVSIATPSTPVVILGLSAAPEVGDEVLSAVNDKKIREIAEFRKTKIRDNKFSSQYQAPTLDNIFSNLKEGEIPRFNILLKSDVQGSSQAICESLLKLNNDEVMIKIISSSVGAINESDIALAEASNAIILGFNVRADNQAKKTLGDKKIDLRYYSIIYDLIDDVKLGMSGLLSPEIKEEIVGLAEVKDVFKSSSMGSVAGCQVIEGSVKKGNSIRVLRDNVVIYEGELESLRRHKDDVKEVKLGTECGIAVKNYNDVKPGDNIEVFKRIEVARQIE